MAQEPSAFSSARRCLTVTPRQIKKRERAMLKTLPIVNQARRDLALYGNKAPAKAANLRAAITEFGELVLGYRLECFRAGVTPNQAICNWESPQ